MPDFWATIWYLYPTIRLPICNHVNGNKNKDENKKVKQTVELFDTKVIQFPRQRQMK